MKITIRENVYNKAKKRKKSRFFDFEKTLKNVTCKVLDHALNQFLSCKCKHGVSVSIKLLRPYFNLQFYIMLYVYVIVCCFRAHSVSQRFDKTSKWRRVDTDSDG